MWSTVVSGESTARPAEVYALLADPDSWPEWDESVERVELAAPFGTGTEAVMVLAGGVHLALQITWVEPEAGFTSEASIPAAGVVVRVRHELAATASGTRITYRVDVDGPDEAAAEVGAAVSADFPAVIAALAAHAERSGGGAGHQTGDRAEHPTGSQRR